MSDCSYKDEITCPYCGYEQSDSWECTQDEGESECPECGKEFSYIREHEIHYPSYCKEGLHDYEHSPSSKIPDCYTCKNCDNYQFKDHLVENIANMERRVKECEGDESKMYYINHALERDKAILAQLP